MAMLYQSDFGDSYWRLPQFHSAGYLSDLRQSIRTAGYHVPSRCKEKDMIKIAQRTLLQQPEYKYCTLKELRKFARERKIPGITSKTYKTALVEALRQADQDRTFPRFSDLPAELRCRVYEEHIGSFPSTLDKPTQPPLARASRLIRQECLPLFYRRLSFEIFLDLTDHDWTLWRRRSSPIVKFSAKSLTFLESLSPETMAEIRHWKLKFNGLYRLISIDINTILKSVAVELKPGIYQKQALDTDQIIEKVAGAVEEVFDHQATRTSLSLSEMLLLRRKVEEIEKEG